MATQPLWHQSSCTIFLQGVFDLKFMFNLISMKLLTFLIHHESRNGLMQTYTCMDTLVFLVVHISLYLLFHTNGHQ